MNKSVVASIVSGFLAAGVFLLFYIILNVGVLPALGLGLLGYVGSMLLMPTKSDSEDILALGVTRAYRDEVVKLGREKVKHIEKLGMKIEDMSVKMDVENICKTAYAIFDDFIEDPKDVKVGRKFLNYYLDTSVKILERYVSISNKHVKDASIEETLRRTERVLSKLDSTFNHQMRKLLDDDIMDLDVELAVLEKTIEGEDLG